MYKNLIKKYCILQFAVLLSSNVLCQINDARRYYYQDELDYLPHFLSYQLAGGQNVYEYGLEFNKVLEVTLNSCSDTKHQLISHFGMTSRLSGISPIGASRDSYFVIQLDEYGKVSQLEVYNSSNPDQIEECMLEALTMSRINPGLKDLQPVKCYFVYRYN